MRSRSGLIIITAAAAFLAAGCSARHVTGTPGPRVLGEYVITAADPAFAGASTAWDVIERSGYIRMLRRRSAPDGLGGNAPLLVLDGAPAIDGWPYLRQLPAAQVSRIGFLSGAAASLAYGPEAAAGAVVVETWTP